jgi:hypothetical protein
VGNIPFRCDDTVLPVAGIGGCGSRVARRVSSSSYSATEGSGRVSGGRIKEKILADPCRTDPRWLQIQPSSELVAWKRFWPVVPGITHGGLNFGQLSRGSR